MTSTCSAAATGLPALYRTDVDLESAIMDASAMTEVTHALLTKAFGFENAKAPELSDEERHLVYWSICQCSLMIERVETAFHRKDGQ